MKWVTHLLASVCFALILSNFFPISVAGLILVAVSSILPDYLDIVTGANHRNMYTHNLLIPLAATPLVYSPTLVGFVIGYGHHLALDMLTKQGVYFGKNRFRGFLYANNPGHNVLVLLIHYVILLSTLLP